MSVDFRVVQAIERVPEATVGDNRRARLATPNVADVMWRFGAVGEGIHVLGDLSCYLAGPALTVRTRPTDNLMVHKALEVARQGDLVLGDADGVVVVPREAAGEVSSGTRALEKAEGEIVRSISSGGWERGWIDEKLTEKGCELAD